MYFLHDFERDEDIINKKGMKIFSYQSISQDLNGFAIRKVNKGMCK